MSLNYSVTPVTLTANQAAGIDPVLPANSKRHALMIGVDGDYWVAAASGQTRGWPLIGGVPNLLEPPSCPTNALYIVGLGQNSIVSIWEA